MSTGVHETHGTSLASSRVEGITMFTRPLAVLRKETREILRDPYTLGIALVLPLVLLFLFAYGVNTDVRDIELVLLDFDQSAASRDYARAFANSGYFRPAGFVQSY